MDRQRLYALIRTDARPDRRRPRIPEQAFPHGLEIDYIRALRAEVAALEAITSALLLPALERLIARADALDDDIPRITEEMRRRWARRSRRWRSLAERMAARLSRFNLAQIRNQFEAVLTVDVVRSEPWLAAELDTWATTNVGLIQGIGDTAIDQMALLVTERVRSGNVGRSLVKAVEERLEVSRSRATLIARDQTGKLNGRLTQLRQENLGIGGYIWRTVGDARVRDSHARLNRTKHRWSDPGPANGHHPGGDYQCRCWAEPVLDEFADLM